MIEIIPMQAAHVIGAKIQGRIEDADVERIIQATDERLKTQKYLHFYIELISFEGIDAETLWKDLKFAMGHISSFRRKAVLTDQAWITSITDATGSIFPHAQARAFPSSKRAEAIAWIEEDPL